MGARLTGLEAAVVGPPLDAARRAPRDASSTPVATHCFICARLALGLPPSGQPVRWEVQGLRTPVLAHLSLGNVFLESLSISPRDMDMGDDLILGWDWISSHDLRHLWRVRRVFGRGRRSCR